MMWGDRVKSLKTKRHCLKARIEPTHLAMGFKILCEKQGHSQLHGVAIVGRQDFAGQQYNCARRRAGHLCRIHIADDV